jgi:hypothetical protein
MSTKLQRLRDFNSGKLPCALTVSTPLPAELADSLERRASALPPDEFPSAERLFPLWEELLTYRLEHDPGDDSVEFAYPLQYDQGIYGAMFGAKLESLLMPSSGWGWASSNSRPFTGKSYEELLALRFDPENEWLQRMGADLRYFAERSHGRFPVSTIITIDGFNFGHQIRGSAIFADIQDRPDELEALMSLAVEINLQFVEFQRAATGETCADGAVVLGGVFPDRTVAMSVDTYNMCSPATYAEFGRPYNQRLIDHFGGGAFHLHGNGRHLLPEMAQLTGFVQVGIGDDGAATRAFEDREKVSEVAGNLIIGMGCTPEELSTSIREKSLVPAMYGTSCATLDEARRLVEQFRDYAG